MSKRRWNLPSPYDTVRANLHPLWRPFSEMRLNRRHKAILFITLVIVGCVLLFGAELKEAFGTMMLGAALAWA